MRLSGVATLFVMLNMIGAGGKKMDIPKYSTGKWSNRRAVFLENESMKLVVLPGGGHVAAIVLKNGPAANINPLWQPPWTGMEPQDYVPQRDAAKYGGPPEAKLLASINGHNICLDYFGPPSKEEETEGLTVHGEAPVENWQITSSFSISGKAWLNCKAKLDRANLGVNRQIRLSKDQTVLRFDTLLENLANDSRFVGWQEHVTFGPPFLEKGLTVFDANATWGQVIPGGIGDHNRLKPGAEFQWPNAVGVNGDPVDLRVYPNVEKSGDFSTQLMDEEKPQAWFTAVNPKQRLVVGYLWQRDRFPWLGNWEENFSRSSPPWAGKALTRGMEFGLSPFPTGKQEMIRLGKLHDTPTIGLIPAKEIVRTIFYAFLITAPEGCEGVRDVTMEEGKIRIALRKPETTLELNAE